MKHKTKTRRRAPTFKVGATVVAERDAFPGADPFQRLVVLAVHKDGTVDLAALAGAEWTRVPASKLLAV